MIRAYRLAHAAALAQNPDPFRPARSENRWNSADTQVAYAGESLAISAVELLTYWGSYPSLKGYRLFTLDFDEKDVEDVLEHEPGINAQNYAETRRYGDRWVEEGRSLALRVPSVVLPMSYTYLINPNHPRFDPDSVIAHGAFEYEQRIARLVKQAKRAKRRPLCGARRLMTYPLTSYSSAE